MDFWTKALQNLHPDDRKHFSVLQSDPQKILAEILKEARAKRDAAHEKRWKFKKSNGSVVIIRDVFEKIVHSISKYAQAVDVAVSTAPMYAAPLWAVVRFLLQVNGLWSLFDLEHANHSPAVPDVDIGFTSIWLHE